MDWVDLGRNIQPWATIGGMILAACSFLVASCSLRVTSKTNKAKFVFEITESFLKETNLKNFWYRLDYDTDKEKSWKFDLTGFRFSEEERIIDTILYKFVAVGRMMRTGAISSEDAIGLYIICRQFFHNNQIREYLRFVHLDFYCSDRITRLSFEDDLYCYKQLTRDATAKRYVSSSELRDCLAFIAELRAIPRIPALRQEIASRIGYSLREPAQLYRWAWLTSSSYQKS